MLHKLASERGLWIVLGVFLSLTLPVILFNTTGGYDGDESQFHVPTIRKIQAHWPTLDFRDDPFSAVSPGYHYFLASLSVLTGDHIRTLRLLNLLVSLGIPLAIFLFARRKLCGLTNCLLLLPLVTSNFVVKSACWVFTDNAALLLVILAFAAALSPRTGLGHSLRLGGLAGLATFTRQLSVWLVVPIMVRSLLCARKELKVRDRIVMAIGALVPLIVLLKLYLVWGGIVPPAWGDAALKFSLCPVAYLLSTFAIFGIFYLPLSEPRQLRLWLAHSSTRVSLLLGFIIAAATPTSMSHADGRWGGYLWAIVAKLPTIGDRSLFFLVAAPVGAAIIAFLWRAMRAREFEGEALLWLSSVLAWSATFVVNRQVFQRYFEPMVLVFLIFAVIQIQSRTPDGPGRWLVGCMTTLTLVQLAITGATVLRSAFAMGI